MKKAILLALSFIFAVLTALLGHEYWWRQNLPYNEEGRYFDPEIAVVYHEQSLSVVSLMGVVSGLVTAALAWGSWRAWRRKQVEGEGPSRE